MTSAAILPKSLDELAVACQFDPLQFVLCAYPWGEGSLEGEEGPDTWQLEVLEYLAQALTDPHLEGAIRLGIASGHGIGKGTLAAWLMQWFMVTRPRPQIVVTANTESQLTTKTWREMAKWHELSLFRAWFTWTATRYAKTGAEASWFTAALPWNERKPEAFQGTHERYVLIIEDESSAIPDVIHDTIEGSMTTPGAIWAKFGNPTRPQGRFCEIFPPGRFAHRWWTRQIDSRTCKKADKSQIAQWIADYGEDSDFVRVRVKGLFPRTGSVQFIGDDLLQLAAVRSATPDLLAPKILGVDVARFGDDRTVFWLRQGPLLVAKWVYREKDTVAIAGYLGEVILREEPDAVFIDEDGLGAGVVDQCRALGHRVIGVHSGGKARDPLRHADKRAEMWDNARTWLKERGVVPEHEHDLRRELTGPQYGFDVHGALRLESKKEMKARGLASPDEADAFVYTFAEPVAPRNVSRLRRAPQGLPLAGTAQGWMA